MYRRSRTASNVLRKPPHFEYIMRWTWTGKPVQQRHAYWWDSLPQTYEVRRRWIDITKFHEALAADLVYDRKLECRRTRTRLPELPDRGNLDAFLHAVAATGDTCALSRKSEKWRAKADASNCEELSLLHAIYVENRLAPYFAEVSKVLQELPADVLHNSADARRFATSGPSSLQQPISGSKAVLLSPDELNVAAQKMRHSKSLPTLHPASRSNLDVNREIASPVSPPSTSAMSASTATADRSRLGRERQHVVVLSPSGNTSRTSGDDELSQDIGAAQASDRSCERAVTHEYERRRRAAHSHYGFFARQVPKEAFGRPSTRDFWRQMVVKERRELGRRTMLGGTGEADEPHATQGKSASAVTFADPRLPALPPSKMSSTSSSPRSTSTWSSDMHRKSLPSLPSLKDPMNDLLLHAGQIETAKMDICEGLRVIILRRTPLQALQGSRKKLSIAAAAALQKDQPAGSDQETLTIYKTYRMLLEMDGNETDVEASSDEEASDSPDVPKEVMAIIQASVENGRRSGREQFAQMSLTSKELIPVTWPTIFRWIQREIDFSRGARHTSVCKALLRALKLWRQFQATPAQSYFGVSLNMLLQWLWPGATYLSLARMLTCICHHELEKLRQPTPQVIHSQDRRQLEGIFNSLDPKGRGHVTAEDIAGGSAQDLETKLRNIVDADTVRAVCGDGHIEQTEFLELMCEDNFRAHEGATRVLMADGRRIVEVKHKVTGFRGWLHEEVPKSEQLQRRIVEALESEISRYHRLANQRRSVLYGSFVPKFSKTANSSDGFERRRVTRSATFT